MRGDQDPKPGRRPGQHRAPAAAAPCLIEVRAERAGGTEAPRGQATEVRCGCGSLLARQVGTSIELKCRRCKRSWRIPVTTG
jgi:hypothetical protein